MAVVIYYSSYPSYGSNILMFVNIDLYGLDGCLLLSVEQDDYPGIIYQALSQSKMDKTSCFPRPVSLLCQNTIRVLMEK